MKKPTHGRKSVVRSLPPLAEVCGTFKGFAEGENRSERIFELLTVVIQRCRRATPQPFYAMRDVAAFFQISLASVAKVYRRLEREGVLTLVRSSQSIIPARAPRPRFAVRGVVCMPIWLPAFVYFLDWRKWFSQLEEELSRYHFALEPIFYKALESIAPDFVDRVLRFNPDYLLWNWPSESDRAPMLSIADAGVPLLVIQTTSQHQFPGRIYRTSGDLGVRQGLEEWEKSGEIDNIVLPRDVYEDTSAWSMRPILKSLSFALSV